MSDVGEELDYSACSFGGLEVLEHLKRDLLSRVAKSGNIDKNN